MFYLAPSSGRQNLMAARITRTLSGLINSMIVRLYDHAGTALIIPHPTGIVYSNQAGGHACQQPELEGFLVPIANDVGLAPELDFRSPENELFKYFSRINTCGETLDENNAKMIETIMRQLPLWGGLTVDRDRLDESVESWVFVTISATENTPLLVDGITYPVSGVLTWTNSD